MRKLLFVGALAFVAIARVLLSAQAPALSDEIVRLSADAPKVLPEQSKAAVLSRLERSRTALAAKHTYLALYDLQVAFETEAGYRLASTAGKYPTQTAFLEIWTVMGAPAAPPGTRARVLFVEALAQSAEGRAPATYRASRPYAEDSGIGAGLYYLAESHAMVRFAALCRGLSLAPAGPPPALTSIEPVLAAHEATVVKAYDAAAAAERPQYAGVNVAIKQARTLDEQGRHEGAMLQYLVSRFRYGMIRTAGRPAPAVEDLKDRIAKAPIPPGVDHSMAEFFLQLATASLIGPTPSPNAAAVILDDVVHSYFVALKK